MATISLLLLIFLSISSYSIHGNSASALDCSSVIQNMAGCLSFVTIESEVDKPEGLFVLPWSQESDRYERRMSMRSVQVQWLHGNQNEHC